MRRNLVKNPSLETDATNWVATSNCTVARSTAVGGHVGSAALAVTASAAGTMSCSTATGTSGFPVTAGAYYSGHFRARAGSTGRSISAQINFYNSGGSSVGSISLGSGSDVSGSWTQIGPGASSFVAPANSVYAAVLIIVTGPAASEVHYVDALIVQQVPGSSDVAGAYFDGATADTSTLDFGWEGTAHASSSTERAIIGSAANALAAKDMVDRCRAVLLGRAGPNYPPHHLAHATAFGPGSTGQAGGWAEAIAADSASSSFTFAGVFGTQVAVKNNSDGIVYKVLRNSSLTSFYTFEKNVFDSVSAQGKTWAPEYYPYDAYNVMAIKQYTLLDPAGPAMQSVRNPGDLEHGQFWFRDNYSATPEYAGLLASNVRFSETSCGLDLNSKLVLIDGSAGFQTDTLPA